MKAANTLPEDVTTITLEAIAENEGCSTRTIRRNLEKARIRVVYAASRRPSVLMADYRRHLAGSTEAVAQLVA